MDVVGHKLAIVGDFNIIWTQHGGVVCGRGLGSSMAANHICWGEITSCSALVDKRQRDP
jgi:ribose 5-phosphate isomerase RpiB